MQRSLTADMKMKPPSSTVPRPTRAPLPHEHQAHQADLEMQNESLRQSQLTLEKSRDRYAEFHEFAPVGFLALTREGQISEANLRAATMLGLPREQLPGHHFADFVGSPCRDDWHHQLHLTLEQGGTREFGLDLEGADGRRHGVHAICRRRETLDGPPTLLLTLTDISERKRIEQALQLSEARYRQVVEDQTEVIGRVRADGTILFANEVYCRLFGRRLEELIGNRWHPVAHPDDLPMIEARLAELTPAHPVVVIENRVRIATGEMRWMQFVNRAFFDDSGQITEIQAVGRDINERKLMEARKEALLDENTRLGRALIDLQEQERAHLARELHDELSQQLVAIRAHAGAIRRRAMGVNGGIQADAEAIEAAASHIYSTSHRLMEGLHPHLLDSAGLKDVLLAQLSGWSRGHPDIEPRPRVSRLSREVDGEVRIHLFRIVQECLANVARHARAGRVRLFLGEVDRENGRALRLVVRDDGVGLDPDTPRNGYGLIAMRERARSLGGVFQIRSRPGAGTRITVEVPL